MKLQKEALLLYAVTSRHWVGRQSLLEQVEAAIRGGATCVQLREKNLANSPFQTQAMAMKALCQQYHIPLIVNDNVDVALACGADGVHVGQSDLNAAKVRQLVGEEMILGVSVQTVEQALAAQQAGADYLGVGAIFSTGTKADADEVSLQTLAEICAAVSIPVVAIGGINKENILTLSGSGVDGVALVSAIFAGADIASECRQLKALAHQMVAT